MARTPLNSIPDPGLTRSTLVREGEGTVVFTGDYEGPVYTCGSCGAPLIEGVRGTHVVDLMLFCNACGSYNESPAADVEGIDPSTIEKPVMFPPGRYALTEPITLHERWVMASESALREGGIAPVRFQL